MKTSILSHCLFTRRGDPHQQGRNALDFCINGHSLKHMLDRLTDTNESDLIGSLLTGMPEHNQQQRARLLGGAAPETPSGRVMLYICPECGDLGCGAYTVGIKRIGGHVIWQSFAYENGYQPPFRIAHAGPFYFDTEAYLRAIDDAMPY